MASTKPGKLVKAALEKAVEKVAELTNPPIPGARLVSTGTLGSRLPANP